MFYFLQEILKNEKKKTSKKTSTLLAMSPKTKKLKKKKAQKKMFFMDLVLGWVGLVGSKTLTYLTIGWGLRRAGMSEKARWKSCCLLVFHHFFSTPNFHPSRLLWQFPLTTSLTTFSAFADLAIIKIIFRFVRQILHSFCFET